MHADEKTMEVNLLDDHVQPAEEILTAEHKLIVDERPLALYALRQIQLAIDVA